MRTPVRIELEIDDTLVAEAMRVFGLDSRTAAVEEALRRVVREARQREALRELRGIGWESDLDAKRSGSSIGPRE